MLGPLFPSHKVAAKVGRGRAASWNRLRSAEVSLPVGPGAWISPSSWSVELPRLEQVTGLTPESPAAFRERVDGDVLLPALQSRQGGLADAELRGHLHLGELRLPPHPLKRLGQ